MSEEAIINEGIKIDIAGETYTMRRLGLRDVFKVVRILGSGVGMLSDIGDTPTPGQTLQVLIASMTANEEEVLSLVADLIGVTREDLNDPERFPMESVVDIFKTLSDHQDLRAFLSKVAGMMESLPEMQTASQKASNS